MKDSALLLAAVASAFASAHGEIESSVLLDLYSETPLVLKVRVTSVAVSGICRFGGNIGWVDISVKAIPEEVFKGSQGTNKTEVAFHCTGKIQTNIRAPRNGWETDEHHYHGEPIIFPMFPQIHTNSEYIVFLSTQPIKGLAVTNFYCGVQPSTPYLEAELNWLKLLREEKIPEPQRRAEPSSAGAQEGRSR